MEQKSKNEADTSDISSNNKFNIINILLMDHAYLKECIKVLKDENKNKELKCSYARSFVDTFAKHSKSEKSALYDPLKQSSEYRAKILKAEIEHELIDSKIETLLPYLDKMRTLDEVMEIELNVLSDLVEHHIGEEEVDLFPLMKEKIDNHVLNEIGFEFMMKRKFTEKDLKNIPELKNEVSFIKKALHFASGDYLTRTHDYFSETTHLSEH